MDASMNATWLKGVMAEEPFIVNARQPQQRPQLGLQLLLQPLDGAFGCHVSHFGGNARWCCGLEIPGAHPICAAEPRLNRPRCPAGGF